MTFDRIYQPYSGLYEEKQFDIETEWKEQVWTWIKFSLDDFSEWCGCFRGEFQGCGLNSSSKQAIILTSLAFYKIDCENKSLLKTEENIQFNQLTITPDSNYFVVGYFNKIELMDWDFNFQSIDSPIEMDMITFKNWEENNLNFTCYELLNWDWDRHLLCQFSYNNNHIRIINETN
ncbi:hypothetical protein EMA8858_04153 [Emticicia aquatica]|uniref:Uncharacterized protein n=1 Tax=Emticicia aquatica TaxID=1681835 RepID=A0ABM9AW87_9BACT|nr:hypothetical protein [Emticicia aquatica]CAH0998018.1 hypothetical protein EMA8858_04153 [Emticicia aquatica]